MTIHDKRQEVASKLGTLKQEQATSRGERLMSIAYRSRRTRLSAPTIEALYEILTNSSGWGVSADRLRDQMRISVLEVNDHDDGFDGRPFRSDELEILSGILDDRRTTDD